VPTFLSPRAPRGGEFEFIIPDRQDVDAAIAALGMPRTVEEMTAVQRRARSEKIARLARGGR
jgi:hypothetical protein